MVSRLWSTTNAPMDPPGSKQSAAVRSATRLARDADLERVAGVIGIAMDSAPQGT
jgi:hypothetical protein